MIPPKGSFSRENKDLYQNRAYQNKGAHWTGALIGIGALINKKTFEGGAYLKGGAYWKEGAKSVFFFEPCHLFIGKITYSHGILSITKHQLTFREVCLPFRAREECSEQDVNMNRLHANLLIAL